MKNFLLCICLLLTTVTSVPVYVMLSLTTMNNQGYLSDKGTLQNQLQQLKNIGVAGVMGDVWWGITETAPQQYNFNGYLELVQLVKSMNLEFIPVMSFHQCGGNVGDACNIPVPSFVTSVGNTNDNIWYHDRDGVTTTEYISLFADNEALFNGRTPLQMYGDYMMAFASAFSNYMGNTIPEIQIGLGPAGELRYPGYPLSKWSYCGIGEFQSFGTYASASLTAYLHSFSDGGSPSYSGVYSNKPSDVCFFQQGCTNSGYTSTGQQFMSWYTGSLLTHGDNVMALANNAFGSFTGVTTAGKVSGIHWWFGDSSHAAEATSGYNMLAGHNAYDDISAMFAKNKAGLVFTCFEMLDSEQDSNCKSKPEELVRTVRNAVNGNKIAFSAENALPRYDNTAYNTIVNQSGNDQGRPERFTYLRLGPDLMNQLSGFSSFVSRMNQLGGSNKMMIESSPITSDTISHNNVSTTAIVLIVGSVIVVLSVVLITIGKRWTSRKQEDSVMNTHYIAV